ncbi:hypothetical protein M569_07843, partial [Genlisea aurea]
TEDSLSKHAFCDLSHISPLVFLFLLKECYAYGTCKASIKFRALQQQVYTALLQNPEVGPATLVARCLCIMPIIETYSDGCSHLVLSALCRLRKNFRRNDEDRSNSEAFAAELFVGITSGSISHSEAILIQVVRVFDVKLQDIDNVLPGSSKDFVEQYVFRLIELQSCMTAVDLLVHFSMHQSGMPFLMKMIECRQFKAAEKWAMHLGKASLCVLVEEYVKQKLFNLAFDLIKRSNLRQEFPELYHQSKESSLKKLAEKGVWEVAEARAKGDRQLIEYLVYLALEAGYCEKVEELSERYCLEGFLNFKDTGTDLLQHRHLNLRELSIEDVFWVDEVDSLRDAVYYLKGCKVVGVDCEWKPNYEKGKAPSKVSIMQIASEKKVYIFDLIKLYDDAPAVLDQCLAQVLQSPGILKLGYNFQCDVRQLAESYGGMSCFNCFDMLLDIQNVFKEPKGGLSGLAEKILGTGLNKTRRNSNWEQRPLTQNQIEYAALDAAVLVHIFRH